MSDRSVLYKRKYQSVLRVIAILLVAVLTAQEVSFASPEIRPFFIGTDAVSQKDWAREILPDVPESVATVESAYHAPRSTRAPEHRIVILLQDAHTNYSAQKNQAVFLEKLLAKHPDISHVYTEAAWGDVSLSELRDLAPLTQRDLVAERYLRQGLLHGVEYLDILSERRFRIWGVEDAAQYKRSVQTYAAIARKRSGLDAYIAQLEAALDRLAPRLLNPLLQKFESDRQKFRKDELSLTEYLDALQRQSTVHSISIANYKDLSSLERIRAIERTIDFSKANIEMTQAMEGLSDQDKKDLYVQSRRPTAALVAAHPDEALAGFIVAFEEKIPTKLMYPELNKYFEYSRQVRELDLRQVLAEMSLFEAELLEALQTSEDERRWVRARGATERLHELFALTMTPTDYAHYRSRASQDNIESLTGFINEKLLQVGEEPQSLIFLKSGYGDMVRACEEFYELTLKRDEMFVRQMLSKMEMERQAKAVLITGGYHTNNIRRLLEEKGISAIIVAPQVLHETNIPRYEKILLGQDLTRAAKGSPAKMNMTLYAKIPGAPLDLQTLAAEMRPAGARLAAGQRIVRTKEQFRSDWSTLKDMLDRTKTPLTAKQLADTTKIALSKIYQSLSFQPETEKPLEQHPMYSSPENIKRQNSARERALIKASMDAGDDTWKAIRTTTGLPAKKIYEHVLRDLSLKGHANTPIRSKKVFTKEQVAEIKLRIAQFLDFGRFSSSEIAGFIGISVSAATDFIRKSPIWAGHRNLIKQDRKKADLSTEVREAKKLMALLLTSDPEDDISLILEGLRGKSLGKTGRRGIILPIKPTFYKYWAVRPDGEVGWDVKIVSAKKFKNFPYVRLSVSMSNNGLVQREYFIIDLSFSAYISGQAGQKNERIMVRKIDRIAPAFGHSGQIKVNLDSVDKMGIPQSQGHGIAQNPGLMHDRKMFWDTVVTALDKNGSKKYADLVADLSQGADLDGALLSIPEEERVEVRQALQEALRPYINGARLAARRKMLYQIALGVKKMDLATLAKITRVDPQIVKQDFAEDPELSENPNFVDPTVKTPKKIILETKAFLAKLITDVDFDWATRFDSRPIPQGLGYMGRMMRPGTIEFQPTPGVHKFIRFGPPGGERYDVYLERIERYENTPILVFVLKDGDAVVGEKRMVLTRQIKLVKAGDRSRPSRVRMLVLADEKFMSYKKNLGLGQKLARLLAADDIQHLKTLSKLVGPTLVGEQVSPIEQNNRFTFYVDRDDKRSLHIPGLSKESGPWRGVVLSARFNGEYFGFNAVFLNAAGEKRLIHFMVSPELKNGIIAIQATDDLISAESFITIKSEDSFGDPVYDVVATDPDTPERAFLGKNILAVARKAVALIPESTVRHMASRIVLGEHPHELKLSPGVDGLHVDRAVQYLKEHLAPYVSSVSGARLADVNDQERKHKIRLFFVYTVGTLFWFPVMLVAHEAGHFIATKLIQWMVSDSRIIKVRMHFDWTRAHVQINRSGSDFVFDTWPAWQRAFISAGGPAVNILIGFLSWSLPIPLAVYGIFTNGMFLYYASGSKQGTDLSNIREYWSAWQMFRSRFRDYAALKDKVTLMVPQVDMGLESVRVVMIKKGINEFYLLAQSLPQNISRLNMITDATIIIEKSDGSEELISAGVSLVPTDKGLKVVTDHQNTYVLYKILNIKNTNSVNGARLAKRSAEKIQQDQRAELAVLESGPHTARQISDKTGIPLFTVINDLKRSGMSTHKNYVLRPQNAPEKKALIDLVTQPPNVKWEDRQELLTSLKGLSLGQTDEAGAIRFQPYPGYRHKWRVMGFADKGWSVTIEDVGLRQGIPYIFIKASKGDAVVRRTFRVSRAVDLIAAETMVRLRHTDLKPILSIVPYQQLKNPAQKKKFFDLIRTQSDDDFFAKADGLKSMSGFLFGTSTSKGRVTLIQGESLYSIRPLEGEVDKGGWTMVWDDHRRLGSILEIDVYLVKPGQPVLRRTLQLSPKMRQTYALHESSATFSYVAAQTDLGKTVLERMIASKQSFNKMAGDWVGKDALNLGPLTRIGAKTLVPVEGYYVRPRFAGFTTGNGWSAEWIDRKLRDGVLTFGIVSRHPELGESTRYFYIDPNITTTAYIQNHDAGYQKTENIQVLSINRMLNRDEVLQFAHMVPQGASQWVSERGGSYRTTVAVSQEKSPFDLSLSRQIWQSVQGLADKHPNAKVRKAAAYFSEQGEIDGFLQEQPQHVQAEVRAAFAEALRPFAAGARLSQTSEMEFPTRFPEWLDLPEGSSESQLDVFLDRLTEAGSLEVLARNKKGGSGEALRRFVARYPNLKARADSAMLQRWIPGSHKQVVADRERLLVEAVVADGSVKKFEEARGLVDSLANYLRTRQSLKSEIQERLASDDVSSSSKWYLAMGKNWSARKYYFLNKLQAAGSIRKLERDMGLGVGTILEFLSRRPGLKQLAYSAILPAWIPGTFRLSVEKRYDVLVRIVSEYPTLKAAAGHLGVSPENLRIYLDKHNLLTKVHHLRNAFPQWTPEQAQGQISKILRGEFKPNEPISGFVRDGDLTVRIWGVVLPATKTAATNLLDEKTLQAIRKIVPFDPSDRSQPFLFAGVYSKDFEVVGHLLLYPAKQLVFEVSHDGDSYHEASFLSRLEAHVSGVIGQPSATGNTHKNKTSYYSSYAAPYIVARHLYSGHPSLKAFSIALKEIAELAPVGTVRPGYVNWILIKSGFQTQYWELYARFQERYRNAGIDILERFQVALRASNGFYFPAFVGLMDELRLFDAEKEPKPSLAESVLRLSGINTFRLATMYKTYSYYRSLGFDILTDFEEHFGSSDNDLSAFLDLAQRMREIDPARPVQFSVLSGILAQSGFAPKIPRTTWSSSANFYMHWLSHGHDIGKEFDLMTQQGLSEKQALDMLERELASVGYPEGAYKLSLFLYIRLALMLLDRIDMANISQDRLLDSNKIKLHADPSMLPATAKQSVDDGGESVRTDVAVSKEGSPSNSVLSRQIWERVRQLSTSHPNTRVRKAAEYFFEEGDIDGFLAEQDVDAREEVRAAFAEALRPIARGARLAQAMKDLDLPDVIQHALRVLQTASMIPPSQRESFSVSPVAEELKEKAARIKGLTPSGNLLGHFSGISYQDTPEFYKLIVVVSSLLQHHRKQFAAFSQVGRIEARMRIANDVVRKEMGLKGRRANRLIELYLSHEFNIESEIEKGRGAELTEDQQNALIGTLVKQKMLSPKSRIDLGQMRQMTSGQAVQLMDELRALEKTVGERFYNGDERVQWFRFMSLEMEAMQFFDTDDHMLSAKTVKAYRALYQELVRRGYDPRSGEADYIFPGGDISAALLLTNARVIRVHDVLPYDDPSVAPPTDEMRMIYTAQKASAGYNSSDLLKAIGALKYPIHWELEALGATQITVTALDQKGAYEIDFVWAYDSSAEPMRRKIIFSQGDVDDAPQTKEHGDQVSIVKANLFRGNTFSPRSKFVITFEKTTPPSGYDAVPIDAIVPAEILKGRLHYDHPSGYADLAIGSLLIRKEGGSGARLSEEARTTKQKLVSIMTVPATNGQWKSAKLPTFENEYLGTTDKNGRITLSVAENYAFQFFVLGFSEEGWKVVIERGVKTNGIYELGLLMTKDGQEAIRRTMQIGDHLIPLHHKSAPRKNPALMVRDIADDLGNKMLADILVLSPSVLSGEGVVLPDLHGYRFYQTDINGETPILVDDYVTYRLRLLGKSQKGWVGKIISSRLENGIFTFEAEMTKDGETPIVRVFQVGLQTETLQGRLSGDKGEGRPTKTISRLSQKLGLDAIASLVAISNDEDFEQSAKNMPSLRGAIIGSPNTKGQIPFAPKQWFNYYWNAIDFPEDGYIGVIKRSSFEDGLFHFSVAYSRPDSQVSFVRNYVIGRSKISLSADKRAPEKVAPVSARRILVSYDFEALSSFREKLLFLVRDLARRPNAVSAQEHVIDFIYTENYHSLPRGLRSGISALESTLESLNESSEMNFESEARDKLTQKAVSRAKIVAGYLVRLSKMHQRIVAVSGEPQVRIKTNGRSEAKGRPADVRDQQLKVKTIVTEETSNRPITMQRRIADYLLRENRLSVDKFADYAAMPIADARAFLQAEGLLDQTTKVSGSRLSVYLSATRRTGAVMIGSTKFHIKMRGGQVVIYQRSGLLWSKAFVATSSSIKSQLHSDTTQLEMSQSDFMALLKTFSMKVDVLDAAHTELKNKNALAVFHTDRFVNDKTWDESLRVLSAQLAKIHKADPKAHIVLEGVQAQRIYRELIEREPRSAEFIYLGDENIPAALKNAPRTILEALDRVSAPTQGEGRRLYVQALPDGAVYNYHDLIRLALIEARMGELTTSNPVLVDFMRTWSDLLGEPIQSLDQFIRVLSGHEQDIRIILQYAFLPKPLSIQMQARAYMMMARQIAQAA